MEPQIQLLAEGGIVVVDNVVLNAWHTAYTFTAAEALERALTTAEGAHPGRLCALGVYRYRRLRPTDLPDAATRELMKATASSHRYQSVVTVMDTPGVWTSAVRMFIAGLLSVSKMPMHIADSIEEGVGVLGSAGCDVSVVEPALRALVQKVFDPQPGL